MFRPAPSLSPSFQARRNLHWTAGTRVLGVTAILAAVVSVYKFLWARTPPHSSMELMPMAEPAAVPLAERRSDTAGHWAAAAVTGQKLGASLSQVMQEPEASEFIRPETEPSSTSDDLKALPDDEFDAVIIGSGINGPCTDDRVTHTPSSARRVTSLILHAPPRRRCGAVGPAFCGMTSELVPFDWATNGTPRGSGCTTDVLSPTSPRGLSRVSQKSRFWNEPMQACQRRLTAGAPEGGRFGKHGDSTWDHRRWLGGPYRRQS